MKCCSTISEPFLSRRFESALWKFLKGWAKPRNKRKTNYSERRNVRTSILRYLWLYKLGAQNCNSTYLISILKTASCIRALWHNVRKTAATAWILRRICCPCPSFHRNIGSALGKYDINVKCTVNVEEGCQPKQRYGSTTLWMKGRKRKKGKKWKKDG